MDSKTPDERLTYHIQEAHGHILAARDLIYGTYSRQPLKRGYRMRMALDRINNLMFLVEHRNRKESPR